MSILDKINPDKKKEKRFGKNKKKSKILNQSLDKSKAEETILLTISEIGKELSEILRNGKINLNIAQKTENKNKSGDNTKAMDIIANELFIDKLSENSEVASILSEELDGNYVVNESGSMIVTLDPLDGSSNIEAGHAVGTIFSILDRSKNVLQPGNQILISGYILFGSSTVLVYTSGSVVNGYTLSSHGQYILTHPKIRIPDGNTYAINEGYTPHFPKYIKDFLDHLKTRESENQISLSYSKCMVADVHKFLLQGGVFIYPETDKKKTGKIRLIYEVNPLTFLIRAAGGRAYSGQYDPLQIQPEDIHQKVPIIIGSNNLVDIYYEFWDKAFGKKDEKTGKQEPIKTKLDR